jgi:hypothetical protein
MRFDFKMRSLMVVILAGGIAACDSDSLTQPRAFDADAALNSRVPVATTGQPTRPEATRPTRTLPQRPVRPERPDSVRRPERPDTVRRHPCRADNELTPAQAAAIRALYDAYQEEVGGYLRLIAELEQQLREAMQAGAPRERIEKILAEIDRAKQHIEQATARLRDAVKDILNDDRLPCSVVIQSVPVGGR